MINDNIFQSSNCNYIEFTILPLDRKNTTNDSFIITPINFTKTEFYAIMRKICSDESLKYFQKEYKQFVSNDLIYENKDNDDIRVYKKAVLNERVINDRCIFTAFNKTKLSILAFPCSLNINDIAYVKKLTFRINNRIYLNFEIKYYESIDKQFYRIYINYNHDTNVDLGLSKKILEKLIMKIK